MAGAIQENAQIDDARDLVGPADNAEPIVESRQAERQPEPETKEEPKPPREGGLYDNKRAAIAERLKAQRQAQDANPAIEIPEEMERKIVGPNVATRADRLREPEPEQPARQVETADIPAPTRRRLKVNGQDVEVDEDQMTALAQKALASENILEEAKRDRATAQERLAEVERLLANHGRTAQPQPQPAAAKAEDTKPATDDELDAIIDLIQTGDQKEAAGALRKYGDQLLAKARNDLGNIDQRIAATIQQTQRDERVRAETQKTLDSFISENPDFSQSQRRVGVLFDTSVEVMRENLFKIGVKPEVLQGFAQHHGLAPQAAISIAYRKLRDEGHQLDDSAKVLMEAANRVRTDFGLPAPQKDPPPKRDTTQFVAERIERKQAMAPQPRRSNITPSSEAAFSEQSLDQKRAEAIRQMRAQRRGR